MNKVPLQLVANEDDPSLDQYRMILRGKEGVDMRLMQRNIIAIEGLLISPEFSYLLSLLVAPFQHLVQVALRVKEREKLEIGAFTGRPSFPGATIDNASKVVFAREFGSALKEKYGKDLDNCNFDLLRLIFMDNVEKLSKKMAEIQFKLHSFPEKKTILEGLECKDWPLIYMILLHLFDQFLNLLPELEKQFSQVEYSFNVLYAPLKVDHTVNDLLLIKITSLIKYMNVIICRLKGLNNFGKTRLVESVLDLTEIYPVYHAQLSNVVIVLMGNRAEIDYESGRNIYDGVRERRIKEFIDNQISTLNKTNDVIGVKITGRNAAFANLHTLHRRNGPSPVLTAESLVDAIEKVNVRLERVEGVRRDLLNLMGALLEDGQIECAELIHRVYLCLTNFVDLSKHNKSTTYFEEWHRDKKRLGDILAARKRSESSLMPVENLPAAASSSTESTSTESSSTEPTSSR